jgi:hypothetical protein
MATGGPMFCFEHRLRQSECAHLHVSPPVRTLDEVWAGLVADSALLSVFEEMTLEEVFRTAYVNGYRAAETEREEAANA